jgi:hypothetical protein
VATPRATIGAEPGDDDDADGALAHPAAATVVTIVIATANFPRPARIPLRMSRIFF